MEDFAGYTVPRLKDYLKTKGISVTGYRKQQLVQLAACAAQLNLEDDPDLANVSVETTVKARLAQCKYVGTDPLKELTFSNDFGDVLDVGLYDVFNYLIIHRADYDRRKLRGYKSFEDYRLFYDGYVQDMQCCHPDNADHLVCIKAQVKPQQRDKTYQNQVTYKLWIMLEKATSDVMAAHCHCLGGADGACKHVAAVLFELEAMERKSCTDGPMQWVRRARQADKPMPIKDMNVKSVRYGISMIKKTCEDFDPRDPRDQTPVSEAEWLALGEQIRQANPKACVLDVLTDPSIRQEEDKENATSDIEHMTVVSKAQAYIAKCQTPCVEDFIFELNHSNEEITYIQEATSGQSSNTSWSTVRQGMVTASNFHRVASRMRTLRKKPNDDPSAAVKSIIEKTNTDVRDLKGPLSDGIKNEPKARLLYKQVERKQHKCLKVVEHGFRVWEKTPFMGCSVDGMVTCKCCDTRLLEIKCPHAFRTKTPKEAALNRDCVFDNGTWTLKKNSQYYSQIQGQLGIYELNRCDLVIYTKLGLVKVPVFLDREFFETMTCDIKEFYINYVAPRLIDLQ